jgi:RNA polymerase sigma-70 factor, ECF subfamily
MLQNAVTSLPEIYYQVFLLRAIEELSVNETAEALSISVPSVKVRLHRARMMLQKQLTPLLKNINPSPKRRWLPWS